jgi:hypothetical protein
MLVIMIVSPECDTDEYKYFDFFTTGKKILLSILFQLVLWFTVQILIWSWLY